MPSGAAARCVVPGHGLQPDKSTKNFLYAASLSPLFSAAGAGRGGVRAVPGGGCGAWLPCAAPSAFSPHGVQNNPHGVRKNPEAVGKKLDGFGIFPL